MNYVPPYMNYNQKQGNYDGNLEIHLKKIIIKKIWDAHLMKIQVVETINAVIR